MRYLTTTKVGHRVGSNKDAVRRMCERGEFPNAWRTKSGVGGAWRIPVNDIFYHIIEDLGDGRTIVGGFGRLTSVECRAGHVIAVHRHELQAAVTRPCAKCRRAA